MILLIILLTLTIVSIVWLILDFLLKSNNWPIIIIILFLTAWFGWGVLGSEISQITKDVNIIDSVEVTISSTTVFVEINNKTWEFKEHKDYININDSTSFYYEIDYNMYNSEVSRQLKYKN